MRSIMTLAALVAAALPLAPASAQTMNGYTIRPTWLHSGPLRDYPNVRYVRRGVRVSMHGCLRDWSWCDVTYRANRGWIAGDALRVSYAGRRRNLSPSLGIGVISFSFGSYWDTHYQSRSFYGERQRWQTQYDTSYRPEWGEREQRRGWETESNRGQYRAPAQGEGQHVIIRPAPAPRVIIRQAPTRVVPSRVNRTQVRPAPAPRVIVRQAPTRVVPNRVNRTQVRKAPQRAVSHAPVQTRGQVRGHQPQVVKKPAGNGRGNRKDNGKPAGRPHT